MAKATARFRTYTQLEKSSQKTLTKRLSRGRGESADPILTIRLTAICQERSSEPPASPR
jgi:hypothetical protein